MKDPRRGEVWLVDLGLAAKVRPGLVLSVPVEDRDRALVTLVSRTTSLPLRARSVRLESRLQRRERDQRRSNRVFSGENAIGGARIRPLASPAPASGLREGGLLLYLRYGGSDNEQIGSGFLFRASRL